MTGEDAKRLISAAYKGDAAGLRALLAEGCDANATDSVGWFALHQAACGGDDAKNVEAATVLLDHGASVDLLTPQGETAVMAAAFRGHARVAKLLVERGADVSRKASDGPWSGKCVADIATEGCRYKVIDVAALRAVLAALEATPPPPPRRRRPAPPQAPPAPTPATAKPVAAKPPKPAAAKPPKPAAATPPKPAAAKPPKPARRRSPPPTPPPPAAAPTRAAILAPRPSAPSRGNQPPVSGQKSIVVRFRSSSASIFAAASGFASRRAASAASTAAAPAAKLSSAQSAAKSREARRRRRRLGE
ncbi:hypothetical protein JL720_3530 [Aureococcus anophagefferens]|nr:hypothetical protein JL720_3530 [Aureococcus anophagefferens]